MIHTCNTVCDNADIAIDMIQSLIDSRQASIHNQKE